MALKPKANGNKSYRDIIGKRQHVPFVIDREAGIDVEARTVELSILSDQPIQQWWFGRVILDHKKKSVRMDRAKEGLPLLLNHDCDRQIGLIENVRIENGKTRGTARFSRSALAEETFQDVRDGIRRTASAGFVIHEIKLESSKDGEDDTYRSTDWEPFEGTLATIPADISVGVGRSAEDVDDENGDPPASEEEDPEERASERSTTRIATRKPKTEVRSKPMTEEERLAAEAAAALASRTPAQLLQARTTEFIETAALFGETEEQKTRFRTMARTLALDDTKTLIDLKRNILEAMKKDQVAIGITSPAAVAARQGIVPIRRYQSLKVFKGDGADERAYRFGMAFLANACSGARGAEKIPLIKRAQEYCIEHGLMQRVGQLEGDNAAGGFTVQEEWSQDFIDLREQFGVIRRYTKVEPMASETKTIMRRTGGLSFYAAGEEDTASTSNKNWDRVGLVAKKWLCFGKMSSEINEDSIINQADDLAAEMAYAAAKLEDECGFNGDGSGDATSATGYQGITGIRNKLLGLSSTRANIAGLVVGAGNLWSELLLTDFEGVVGLLPQYADTPNARWFCHRTFFFNCMKRLLLAQGGSTAAEAANLRETQFLGYPVVFSQVFPKVDANDVIPCVLGDLSLGSRLGNRSDLTIMLSEHSSFSTDALDIRGRIRFDFVAHDVGNATSVTADKQPGPIVGLLTAAS